jgi:nucleoside-diphosphate-sugar epimerase
MRIAITGVSGFVGQALVERLAKCEEVESIVGVDLKPFGSQSWTITGWTSGIRR